MRGGQPGVIFCRMKGADGYCSLGGCKKILDE
jgi:hypothetical protein